MPAGTGVCVVKTVRARTTCSACSGSTPSSTRPRTRSMREEAGVALVHVEDGGLDAAGRERLDAADAEQDLLAQAVLAVAAVEAVGDGALGRRIVVARPRPAGAAGRGRRRRARAAACSDGAGERHARRVRRAVGAEHGRQGQERRVELDELLLLGAAGRQQLAEVAVAVEEADADDRHAEVARRLEVVAGEDPRARPSTAAAPR